MGYPERISTLPCHNTVKIRELSPRDREIGGPVPEDLVD